MAQHALGPSTPVVVVGGGLAGVTCARRLHLAGVPVRLLDRGRRLGGRMSTRAEQLPSGPHPVDIGAPYFTVREPGFDSVVLSWRDAGLVRAWTDTFTLTGPDGPTGSTSGPQRWSSTRGSRALIEQQAEGLDVHLEHEVRRIDLADPGSPGPLLVDGEPAAAVVLAMPDPQAARLLPPGSPEALAVGGREWSPVLTVWAAWSERWWAEFDGLFVAGSEVLTWVADSGRSRADGAAVLVAHSTAHFARPRLDDPPSGIGPMLAELHRVVPSLASTGSPAAAGPEPIQQRVHRWSLASAVQPHPEPYLLSDRLIGICGDGWGPQSRVEQAWISGDGLAAALLERLPVSS